METPKCPECGKELDFLRNFVGGEMSYDFTIDEEGRIDYEENEFQSNYSNNDYECPHCGGRLAETEEEAKRLLLPKESQRELK